MADQPDQQDIASDSDHALEDGGRSDPEPEVPADEHERQHGSNMEVHPSQTAPTTYRMRHFSIWMRSQSQRRKSLCLIKPLW
jgi:hypothetical protein